MKAAEFKSIIKESVREVIQEELKEILLEALRAPKSQVVAESTDAPLTNKPSASGVEKRAIMENIMGDMRRGQDTLSFTSADAQGMGNNFQAPPGAMPGGDLPAGNVGLDQIMGLMNKK
jgi:hypothetical protein